MAPAPWQASTAQLERLQDDRAADSLALAALRAKCDALLKESSGAEDAAAAREKAWWRPALGALPSAVFCVRGGSCRWRLASSPPAARSSCARAMFSPHRQVLREDLEASKAQARALRQSNAALSTQSKKLQRVLDVERAEHAATVKHLSAQHQLQDAKQERARRAVSSAKTTTAAAQRLHATATKIMAAATQQASRAAESKARAQAKAAREVGVLREQLDILADGQAKVDDMARQKVDQAQLAEKRAREKVRHAETLAASAQKTLRQAAGYRCRADTRLRLQQDVHEADIELLQERLASTKAKVHQARVLGADARVDVRAAAKGAREADQARVAAEVSACCASTCCHYPHLAASIRLCSNFF